uniref:Peptidase A2 domain-containing protein n=1 Tax=Panagrolaimus sp. PS1159 TaxID=55785 RepID=A0AC35EYZ7_9BILA
MTNSPTKKTAPATAQAPASTSVPAIDSNTLAAAFDAFTQMQAQRQSQNPTPAPMATTTRTFPAIPTFRPDLAKANYASTWFAKLESLFRLQTFTDGEKCALAVSALDESAFEDVARALLPEKLQSLADFAKLEKTMVDLYDRTESVFAKRYAAFNLEWKGPEYESPAAYAARVREQVGAMDWKTFNEAAGETMCMLLGMKHPALESFRMQVLNLLTKDPATSMNTCVAAMNAALQTNRDQRLIVNPNVNFVQKKVSTKVSTLVKKGGERPNQNLACPSCGGRHNRKDCKFKDAECRFCHIQGHIESVCRKKAGSKNTTSNESSANHRSKPQPRTKVNSVYIQNVYQSMDSLAAKRHMVDITINNVTFTAQLDDGADVTILSEADYRAIGSPSLSGPGLSAKTANGQKLKIRGSFTALVTLKGKEAHVHLHVAEVPFSLLGINFFQAFRINIVMDGDVLCNMVADESLVPAKIIDDLKKEYKSVFEPGLGCCTKRKIILQLKKDVTPTYVRARRPSLHAAELIKAKFKRLSKEDVVQKVGTSPWAAPCSLKKRRDYFGA